MAASGSGKGLWIKSLLAAEKPPRLVIWDYKDEYRDHAKPLVHSLEKVRAAMIKARGGPLQIRYKCKPGTTSKQTMAEFEGLCRLVQAWGNCCFLAEELSNVTTPGWAPAAWREMTTGGRHEKVFIIGVAQNPALIDKTFLSKCTLVHVGPHFRNSPTRPSPAARYPNCSTRRSRWMPASTADCDSEREASASSSMDLSCRPLRTRLRALVAGVVAVARTAVADALVHPPTLSGVFHAF